MLCSPHIFFFRFCIWRSFKNKSNVCHVFCIDLYMLDVTHSQVDVETGFGVVSLILIFFINFRFNKITFGLL